MQDIRYNSKIPQFSDNLFVSKCTFCKCTSRYSHAYTNLYCFSQMNKLWRNSLKNILSNYCDWLGASQRKRKTKQNLPRYEEVLVKKTTRKFNIRSKELSQPNWNESIFIEGFKIKIASLCVFTRSKMGAGGKKISMNSTDFNDLGKQILLQ